MVSLGASAGDDAMLYLQGWLAALCQCETLVGGEVPDGVALDDIELLRMTLAACKADVMSLIAAAGDGDDSFMGQQEVLMAFLQAEVATLTGRIKTASSAKRRVRVRMESK